MGKKDSLKAWGKFPLYWGSTLNLPRPNQERGKIVQEMKGL